MAFTWKAPQRMRTPEDTARIVISVAQSMGISPKGIIMALACIKVESDYWCPGNYNDPCFKANPSRYPHDSIGNDGRSTGYYQQQMNAPGTTPWGWGGVYGDCEGTRKRMDLVESTRLFFDAMKRLPYDYNSNVKSAGLMVQDIQRSAFPHRYDQEWGYAQALYNRVSTTDQVPPSPAVDAMLTPGPWTGDPIWLDEVLIAEGLNVKTVPGWDRDGHGDFKDIRGVVCHHTGGNNTPVSEIVNGFSHLPGPLAQIHLGRDGTVTLVCVGVAWHAGSGARHGIPKSMANWHCIGIEAVGAPPRGAAHRTGWPDAEYDAYVKICAAICRRIGRDASWVFSHEEWDNGDPATDEGKWDPGSIDMNIFRRDVQHRIDTFTPVGATGEDMAQVPQQQWDEVYRELRQKHRSRSIYATPGEGTIDTWAGFDLNVDGMIHQELVERLAIEYGDDDAITRVARAAAGLGVVNAPQVIEHAKAVLARVPADKLAAWKQRHQS